MSEEVSNVQRLKFSAVFETLKYDGTVDTRVIPCYECDLDFKNCSELAMRKSLSGEEFDVSKLPNFIGKTDVKAKCMKGISEVYDASLTTHMGLVLIASQYFPEYDAQFLVDAMTYGEIGLFATWGPRWQKTSSDLLAPFIARANHDA